MHPMVQADAGCVALERGPIIYTFEGAWTTERIFDHCGFREEGEDERFRIERICWKVSWRCA